MSSLESLYALAVENSTATGSKMAALNYAQDSTVNSLHQIGMIRRLVSCSILTGDVVKILGEYSGMPALIGNDNQPIFLYQFIEVLDEIVDFDALQTEFPTLSYSQIAGAISFMRKLAQQNAKDIDVDALEDEFELNDADFVATLENAFNDKEVVRVLSQP